MSKRASLKSKKALIVLPYLKNGDGTAVAIMNYYQSLIDDGWHVDFMHLKSNACQWLNEVRENNGNVFELPQANKYTPAVQNRIENVISQGNYDLVHVNMPGHIGYSTLRLARKKGIAVRIFHAHNPKNILNTKTKMSTWLYDYLIQKEATDLIACSKSAGESRFGSKDFRVMRNVIDTDRFQYRSDARNCIRSGLNITNKVVVGVVGRFAAQKNPGFLVHCFAEYVKIESRAFLLWVGDGELKQRVEQELHRLSLDDRYYFAGRKAEVEDWYAAMDLFFLPSVFEGMGIVFLEAQCTGLPCLGSNHVPVETEVTELMHRLDLNLPEKVWALEMKKITDHAEAEVRQSRANDFIASGYSHEATKDDLKNYYNHLF
ncbi:glycosyltransferase [Butyricicoccus porcorum]|uniref:Glycosyltransferase subfamily 4-like N-terminal domain-containing protein n=1 Tax=Butyricicoccus porcorum TaxID=1945634 RepID=A0A252F3B2_9FIRM|nr:glycosyltransferase [Butyricicoccus porcorum]OUM20304.1 hypothetical protein CBW42_08295 [Butyricicoccus porcorum]